MDCRIVGPVGHGMAMVQLRTTMIDCVSNCTSVNHGWPWLTGLGELTMVDRGQPHTKECAPNTQSWVLNTPVVRACQMR